MEGEETSVGIDVSKSVLDVSLYHSGNTWQVEYSPPRVTGLAEELADLGPTVVVVEATGGLEMSLTAVLGVAGLPVAVVNPKRVRDFACATGRLAKPINWMPRCWPSLARWCGPKSVHCLMPPAWSCGPW